MAFPLTAVQGSFAVITPNQVWRGIQLNIAGLGVQEQAPSFPCGSGSRFYIFCIIFFFNLTNGTQRALSKKGEVVKPSAQTSDSSNLPF